MTRRPDLRTLILAVLVEGLLIVLAAFGGPHGALGGWPWALQLPGILILLIGDGEAHFAIRVFAIACAQVVVWYVLLRQLQRKRTSRR